MAIVPGYAALVLPDHCTAYVQSNESMLHGEHGNDDSSGTAEVMIHHDTASNDCSTSNCCPAICTVSVLPLNEITSFASGNSVGFKGYVSYMPMIHPDPLLRPPIS